VERTELEIETEKEELDEVRGMVREMKKEVDEIEDILEENNKRP